MDESVGTLRASISGPTYTTTETTTMAGACKGEQTKESRGIDGPPLRSPHAESKKRHCLPEAVALGEPSPVSAGEAAPPGDFVRTGYIFQESLVRRGRWLRNVPRRLQSLEDSLSDEGGGDTHGRSTIGVPLASRPWIPYPRFPDPMPPP